MAVIGRIRKYSGLLVIIVGVALAGFVLQDMVRKTGSGRSAKEFGEVNGEKIAYRDYEAKVEEQLEQMKKQSEGQTIANDKVYQLRTQVWNQMVKDMIMSKQYDELGLIVTTDELYDLVQGREPHQYIVQNFTNPKTKQLDRDRINQFLHNFDQLQPEVKQQWVSLEKAIKEDRINKKYNTLIANSFYYPTAFAKRNYNDRSIKASVRFISLPYTSVNDNDAAVSDDDLKKAYDDHKKDYELTEPVRSVDFVVFDVPPSADDMKKATEDIMKIKDEMLKTTDKEIANFVNSNSDAKYDSTFLPKGKLPVKIDSAVFKSDKSQDASNKIQDKKSKGKNKKSKVKSKDTEVKTASTGLIIGPYLENNTYYLAKLIDIQNRPDSMKAKHILISYQGAQGADQNMKLTKAQAKKKTDSIMEVVKKHPEQFENLARTISNDPTAKEKGGDLGWFADGMMVYPFNQACLNNNVGDIVKVETMFGFHVIQLTGKKEPVKKARVAIVKRVIDPSSKTIQEVYTKESRFLSENPNLQAFTTAAAKQGLNKRSADYLREMDNSLPGLEQAREIVRWSFDEKTKMGDVKDFEVENKYVVAAVKAVRKKGIPDLDAIKNEITTIARKDKKAEILTNKLNQSKGSAIEQLAQKFNTKLDTARNVNFTLGSLPGSGNEPAVIGTLFTLKKGEVSKPVKGEKGVFVISEDDIVYPNPITDYRREIMQQMQMFRSRVGWELYNSLQQRADITDNRILYY